MRHQQAVRIAVLLSLVWIIPTAAADPIEPATGTPTAADFSDASFQKNWHDGKAELAGYELTFPRYDAPRKGTAVTIFVTEPSSNSARVKADPGKHPSADEFPVMKLNLVQDFATGVYDYNLMTSVFVALSEVNSLPAGSPTKVSFSSQEWCGQVYEQLLFDNDSIRRTRHSYFDGEADASDKLEAPTNGISEDVLLLWARGMAGPFLKPGESTSAPLLRSVQLVRLNHIPMKWETAKFTRIAETTTIAVPAGEFEVETRKVEVQSDGGADGGRDRTWTIYTERAFPHRIIKWECSDGQKAELLGCDRLTYWQMNGPGFEEAVKKFGLTPRPARTP